MIVTLMIVFWTLWITAKDLHIIFILVTWHKVWSVSFNTTAWETIINCNIFLIAFFLQVGRIHQNLRYILFLLFMQILQVNLLIMHLLQVNPLILNILQVNQSILLEKSTINFLTRRVAQLHILELWWLLWWFYLNLINFKH